MDGPQKRAVAEWLDAHIGGVCPSCNQAAAFEVIEDLVAPVVVRDHPLVPNPLSIPLVGLICTNCYHVRFFSAVLMGILPGNPPPSAGAAGETVKPAG